MFIHKGFSFFLYENNERKNSFKLTKDKNLWKLNKNIDVISGMKSLALWRTLWHQKHAESQGQSFGSRYLTHNSTADQNKFQVG